MPQVFVTPDALLNQVKRDALKIATSFDALCEADMVEISSLFGEASTIVCNGMQRAIEAPRDDDLRLWSSEVLLNIANTLSAAVLVLRAGYRLVPGIIVRNAMEALAVCLHGLLVPGDLSKIRTGKFNSTDAIAAAKRVIPSFGLMYGHLSNQFVHIGPLHNSVQPPVPFEAREDDLVLNLRVIRAAVSLFYVVAEFAFLDRVSKPRYWRFLPPNEVIYEPSADEQAWLKSFLNGPDELNDGK